MNIKLKTLVLALIFVAFNFAPVAAEHCDAENSSLTAYETCMASHAETVDDYEILSSPQGGLDDSDDISSLDENPIIQRLRSVVSFLLTGIGIVITISVVIAGIQYTTSNGDPQKTQRAVSRLTYAGIALFLWIFGLAILQWILPGGTIDL